MIEIWKEPPFNTFHFKGVITDSEISKIYCDATTYERHTLDLMMRVANESKRMSDILMFISELVRVGEDIAKRKNSND
jgi:hypothetical protein